MMDEYGSELIWATALVLIVALLCGSIGMHSASIHQQAMENGYHQSTLPGVTGVWWVKDGEILEAE